MGKHPTHSIHATLNGLPVSSKRRETNGKYLSRADIHPNQSNNCS